MDSKTLRALIENERFIRRLPDGNFVAFTDKRAPESPPFSLVDAAAIEPRLPAMLCHAYRVVVVGAQSLLSLALVRKALQGWEQPPVTVLSGHNIYNEYVQVAIYGFIRTLSTGTPGVLHLYTQTMLEETTDDGITYANNFPMMGFHMKKAVLDADFPEWEKRFEAAKALDLSPRETAVMVFGDPPLKHAIDMQNVTFD